MVCVPQMRNLSRDAWGIPHIVADTELEAVYAQGYAQAEDRLNTLLRSYRLATGQMAAVFGSEWLEHDVKQRVFRHEAVARSCYPTLAEPYQQAMQAFIDGIRRYMDDHPTQVPTWALLPEPHHILTLSRYLYWPFILHETRHPESGIGSNAWAVAPQRTTTGGILMVSDPHLPWSDEWLLHECHLQGGGLHVYGAQVVGIPYIGFGHNERIGWAYTSGGADACDIYTLRLNAAHDAYWFEGEWLPLRVETFEIAVLDAPPVTRTQVYSQHGPLLAYEGNTAYAWRTAYDDRVFDYAIADLNKARDVFEVQAILGRESFSPLNILVADVLGTIYWESSGRIPQRPTQYDWTAPVAGDTRTTLWGAPHPPSDLPRLLNPPTGWLQHTNIMPWAMFPDCPLTPDDYPLYLLTGQRPTFFDGSNARGRYLARRLAELNPMTLDDALALAMDCTQDGARPLLQALFAVYQVHQPTFTDLHPAIQRLQAWDRQATLESSGMSLFWEWFLAMPTDFSALWNAILQGQPLDPTDQLIMLEALEDAVANLEDQWGTLEVAWGQVHQMRRGDRAWGVSGGIGLGLRVIAGAWEPDTQGIYTANFGQAYPMVLSLTPTGIQSWSALPFGQSADPASPHFSDQAEKLFRYGKLKETQFIPKAGE